MSSQSTEPTPVPANFVEIVTDVRENLLGLARQLRDVVPPTELTARHIAEQAGKLRALLPKEDAR